MSWWLTPMYSPAEVVTAILLAALPMSQIANILLGLFEKKTGINTGADNDNK